MKSKQQGSSFIRLSVDAFGLLSRKQRAGAFLSTGSSLLQAVLEVLSITTIIPIFFAFLKKEQEAILGSWLPFPMSWKVLLVAVILVFLVKNSVSLLLIHYQFTFVHNVFIALSRRLYKSFYKQPWTEYLKQNSADTVRRIKHAPSDFSNYILQGYFTLVTDVLICLLMTLLLLWYNTMVVFIVALLSVPIIMVYYWFRTSVVARVDKAFRDLTPRGNVVITQGIDSFAEAKVYQKEAFFINHFMILNEMTSRYLANLKSAASIPPRLFEMVGVLSFAAVVTYAEFNPDNDSAVLILLGLLSLAMYRLIPSLNRILASLSQIQAYAYCVTELKESFYTAPENPAGIVSDFPFHQRISVDTVSFRYPDNPSACVLDNLSLTINKGDFVVLEGASGSGKTTFIHILAGLITDYKGKLVVDHEAITPENINSWQRKLAFVPQAPIVLQETILQNVAFGEEENDIRITEVEAALKNAGLYDFILSNPLGLHAPVGENGLTLSGGQRQRLVLARALYRKPEVLLLDEVTNQLDYDNKVKVLETLRALSARGITVVLASHDPVVRGFANNIIQLSSATPETTSPTI